jgi:hypothetical protein
MMEETIDHKTSLRRNRRVTTNTPAHSETHLLFGFSKKHDVLGSNTNKAETIFNQSLRFFCRFSNRGVITISDRLFFD